MRKRPISPKTYVFHPTVVSGVRNPCIRVSQKSLKRPNRRRSPWSTSFPPELYRNIIEWVSHPADLYNLCLTSRICHFEAQRILYRTIDLPQNTRAPALWAATMLDCPRHAMAVQSLTLRFDTAFLIVPHMLISSLQLISQALRSLRNLRKLFLVGHPKVMMHPIYNWLLDGYNTNLEVFHNSLLPPSAVIPFLLRQPNIRQWKQAGTFAGTTTEDNLLPLATYLDVHSSVLPHFSTPRPLVRLKIIMDSLCDGEGKGEREIIKHLSLFGPTLTSLIIECTSTNQDLATAELLSLLSDATPNLKSLSCGNIASINPFVSKERKRYHFF